jgi:hypothetical protein
MALDLTWVTKPLEGPNSSWDVYYYFPMGYHRKERSNKHLPLPIFGYRNNEPNEALEYVQTYIDNLLVITRGTLEDHLAQLKVHKRMHNAGLRISTAKSCLCTYKSNILRKYVCAEGVTLPPSEDLCPSGGSNSPAAGARNLTQSGEKGKNESVRPYVG